MITLKITLKTLNYLFDLFIQNVLSVIEPAVSRYIDRDFNNLSIYFGCTGGQHRSVYCADAIAKYFKNWPTINVHLQHVEQEKKNWINE